MKYEVLNEFEAKEHKGTLYKKDDIYPKKGFKADEKRVAFLQEVHPEYKVSFLGEEIKEEKQEKGANAKKEEKKPESKKKTTSKKSGEDK